MKRFFAWVFLVAGLLTACGTGTDPLLRADKGEPRLSDTAPSQPSCREGDFLKMRSHLFGTDTPGGAASPEAAVETEFQPKYPGLGPERFSKQNSAATGEGRRAVFDYDDADGGAQVITEFIGDSWHVVAFSICQATIAKERSAQ